MSSDPPPRRRSSPRPTFDGPTAIPYERASLHLWGDDEAGEVADWIYASTTKIHQLLFALAPGQAFRHSANNRTVFAADELLYVVSGVLVIANPETGEVHRAETGEAVFFRRDTWHHAFSFGTEQLRVLELFAPPPAAGAASEYARTRPELTASRYTDDSLLGRWPEAAATRRTTIQVLRAGDALQRLDGDGGVLVSLYASTEHLTAGVVELLPGRRGSVEAHAGEETIYVLDGTVNVLLPESEGQTWFELGPGDGMWLPEGTPHRYHNVTARPASFLFGVAPDYRPPAAV